MAAWAASVMADNIKIDTKIICLGGFLSGFISRRFPEVVNVFMMTMAVVGGLQAAQQHGNRQIQLQTE